MAKHFVRLRATRGLFDGFAKQNLLFHQCIMELIDNAISAKKEGVKIIIDIILKYSDVDGIIDVYICDNGCGMDLDGLSMALQPGKEPLSKSRLNEHGFGLKNALATLSNGNGWWQIWTTTDGKKYYTVQGPFKEKMDIQDVNQFPDEPFLPINVSTIIKVKVKLEYMQTVQGRGAPSTGLETLRSWLIEHLGVAYRGYLTLKDKTQDTSAKIIVSIGKNNHIAVPPIEVPFATFKKDYFDVELNGNVYTCLYKHGTLDEVKRDSLIYGQKAKFYYQGNESTQGFDIRLGDRVIATRQFETIFKTDSGKKQLARHNSYNDFIGELIIPEIPRGVLTTINNKTDFNLDDTGWQIIFNRLNDFRPEKDFRNKTENALKEEWMARLKTTNPHDEITDEYSVWPTGVKIDVYRKTLEDVIIIYELKVGLGAPIHLCQLRMYWDGLLLNGCQPKEAILIVNDYCTNLETMASIMNTFPTPLIGGKESLPYNFILSKHKDKRL